MAKSTPTKLQYKLLPAQKEYLKHRDESTWCLCAAIGTGKTFVTMLDLCMRVVKDGERWIVASQTWSTVQTIQFKQCEEFLNQWGVKYDYDRSKLIITLKNGGELRGACSSSPNAITGATKYDGCLIDEMALFDNEARQYLEGRCRGLNSKGELIKPKYRYVGSPSLEPVGWAYDFCKNHPEKVTHASMLECEGKTLSREYINSQIESYGGESSPLCRIQVFGELPDETSSASIFRRDHRPKELGYIAMGIDVSGGNGGDEAFFTISDGIEIIHESSMKDYTQKELLAHSLDLYRSFNVSKARVDTTGGYGTYLAEAMEDNKCEVDGINFGQRAHDSESYANARAEGYVNLANRWNDDWGDKCKQERLATGFKMNPSGKLQLIDKEIIKKVIGKSPDQLDSIMLCLYDVDEIKPMDKETTDAIDNFLEDILA